MKRDSRLSGVLHILLHMAEQGGPVTSEVLARAMSTNPVVIRRIMAGLREHGYVTSEKGHGGGWRLAADLTQVMLRDIYAALGEPVLLARLGEVSLADLSADFHDRLTARGGVHDPETIHEP